MKKSKSSPPTLLIAKKPSFFSERVKKKSYTMTPRTSAFPCLDNHQSIDNFIIPIIAVPRTQRKIITKIQTSDFWSNGMKFRLKKLNEEKTIINKTEKVVKNELFNDRRNLIHLEKRNSLQHDLIKHVKIKGIVNLNTIDEIIGNCNAAILNNKRRKCALSKTEKVLNQNLKLQVSVLNYL